MLSLNVGTILFSNSIKNIPALASTDAMGEPELKRLKTSSLRFDYILITIIGTKCALKGGFITTSHQEKIKLITRNYQRCRKYQLRREITFDYFFLS